MTQYSSTEEIITLSNTTVPASNLLTGSLMIHHVWNVWPEPPTTRFALATNLLSPFPFWPHFQKLCFIILVWSLATSKSGPMPALFVSLRAGLRTLNQHLIEQTSCLYLPLCIHLWFFIPLRKDFLIISLWLDCKLFKSGIVFLLTVCTDQL